MIHGWKENLGIHSHTSPNGLQYSVSRKLYIFVNLTKDGVEMSSFNCIVYFHSVTCCAA